MKPSRYRGLTVLFVAASCSVGLSAEEAAKTTPAKLDPAEMKDVELIIPSPGEILSTLKEAKDSDWAAVAEASAKGITPVEDMNTTQAAVLLGRRTAEAFLAIEAKNAGLLEKCSAQILDAAKKLGASEGVLENGKKIKDLAADGKWLEIYPLLDGLYLGAQEDLKAVEDEDSLTIASASGWLTGLAIFSGQVAANYSEAGGKALRQGDLVASLGSRLAALPDSAKAQPSVKAIIEAFGKIQPLVTVDRDASVPEAAVKSVSSITSAALDSLK